MKLRKQLRPFTLLDVNGLGDTTTGLPWWENDFWYEETLDIIEAKGYKILRELRHESTTQKTYE